MLIHDDIQYEDLVPYDDEGITWGVASIGLTPEKYRSCYVGIIRFDTGTGAGRMRLTSAAASSTNGYLVEAGQTIILTRFECEVLRGIRSGGTDCKGWITYYKKRSLANR